MAITIRIEDVYGKRTVYPVCETAKTLCRMTGRKTLTPNDLKCVQDLGYGVVIQPRSFSV